MFCGYPLGAPRNFKDNYFGYTNLNSNNWIEVVESKRIYI